ncbi:5-formyltetrahydrofolate cyclo-ligase [Burkholderia sp. WAC0059]|uniref:5-formyltetrahydrofolate cyclo-ligase n=1 Tax=Burkholderia sp. WAC0059 TaxID=2066022 RepID=UPI0035B55B35
MDPSIACNPLAESKKAGRSTLLETRLAAMAKATTGAAIEAHLDALIARLAPRSIGFYWPLSGEFDARAWVAAWLAGDAARRAALPVIRARHAPLEFHAWTPGAAMREGHHRIPEPADAQPLTPGLLLVPCVGFDDACYRLGYGGGYYDRTLAAWPEVDAPPVTVGIACEACRLDALPREAHDLPLDAIVTEAACRSGARLSAMLAPKA